MRDLKDCQAEVFRRSEKRIKQRRKRRKHIIMTCVPLMLCTTVIFSIVVSNKKAAAPASPGMPATNTAGALTGDMQESVSFPIAKIEVSSIHFSRSYTDAEHIRSISEQLLACSVSGPENSHPTQESVQDETVRGSSDTSDLADGNVKTQGESGSVEYTITLAMDAGEKTEYYLAGNILENRTTNQTYTLSREQVKKLLDLLGTPKP